ncbi:hypothetical protein OSB04_017582 [Centaurea solstitialis]|uniref:PGG domain-containing protein n=1 Tax=Centaurea solstitialis TaxID=347529 RepID=A0AA38W9L7_9ASTR|nr:hypothetical protein OSB04_017582 [Centaurea solstitialis]
MDPTYYMNTMTHGYKIDIPATSSSPPKPNLPRADLLGSREEYFNTCIPLYEASITGNWAAAKVILDIRPELVRFAITEGYDTMLHIVVSAQETKPQERFVENLVKMMAREDLEIQNWTSNTAFCLAAAVGNIKMVTILRNKNPDLLNIHGTQGIMPLYVSALHGKYETLKYLYASSRKLTGEFWTHEHRDWLLQKCVECDFYDVALNIVKDRPELANNGNVLGILARKPNAFNGMEQKLLKRIINSSTKAIYYGVRILPLLSVSRIIRDTNVEYDEKENDALTLLTIIWRNTIEIMPKNAADYIIRGPRDPIPVTPSTNEMDGRPRLSSRMLFVAAEMGNTRFVIELLRAYPDLIWRTNDNGYSIFHVAVMKRHHDIYNLLYEIGSMKDLIIPLKDEDGNNMLHLVGKTSKKMRNQMCGVSLLMQRELLWFKEIEKMMPPSYKEKKNKAYQTPYELFSKENDDLVSQGSSWMKDCMVVATLIVTVAFAVAFTVPGGYNQQIGTPIFIHGSSFLVFVIADAISLFSSSTSLLVFLSILISRHGRRGFIYSLPKKLMIGLVMLFISVAAMMVTFSASFFVLYHNGLRWVPILIATFATMPVIIFAVLQFSLLLDMFRSMYDSRYLLKPKKRMLYNTNPRL